MRMQVLSDAEVTTLHERTLDVLENPGVRVHHAPTLAALARAGAKVDESGGVRFPRELVEELRAEAPSGARMTGLNGRVLEVGGENRYYASIVTDPYVVGFEQGPRRPVLDDIRRNTIVGESLERISAMMRMQYPVADLPEREAYLKSMEVFLCHCTKHVPVYATTVENAREWIGAAEILSSGRGLRNVPLLSLAVAVTSPFVLHETNAQLLELALEYNLPVIPTVCPMAGATSPYTVAGTMLVANVEVMLLVLITQALKPGHPVLYAVGPSVADLRTAHDLYYKAEKALFKTMGAQMARFYGLPLAGETGGTMTWRYDPQNGAESMLYILAAVAGGQHFSGGVGSCHNANGMSAEQIVLQCGMIDQAEYVVRGPSLSERDLALESIRAAGPGGQFLGDDLTVERMRSGEFFQTPHFDYAGGYADSPGAVEMAHETVESLVRNHKPTVPEHVREALGEYFRDLMART